MELFHHSHEPYSKQYSMLWYDGLSLNGNFINFRYQKRERDFALYAVIHLKERRRKSSFFVDKLKIES